MRKKVMLAATLSILLILLDSLVSLGRETITFMWWTESSPEMNKLVEDFEKENPGIKVKFETVPFEKIHDKLIVLVAGGNPPDIAFVDLPWVIDFAARGALVDLTDFIKHSTIVDPEDFVEPLWDAGVYKNRIYGIPMDSECMGLFYRTDMFKDVGLKSPPKNWEEFLGAAKKLTRDTDGDGRIDIYGFLLLGENPYWWYPWLWQNGGELMNKENTQVLFNSEAGVEALKFYTELYTKYHVAPKEYIASNSWEARIPFEQGVGAMITAGAWLMGTLNEEAPKIAGKWTTAPLPRGPVRSATTVAGDTLVMMRGTRHEKEAWKFMEFLARPVNNLYWTYTASLVPVRKSLITGPIWQRVSVLSPKYSPKLYAFAEGMLSGHVGVSHPKWPRIQEELGYQIQLVLYGKKTPKQALDDAAEKAKKILAESE